MGILQDLTELFGMGGITVCTPNDPVLVKSVIQPDADILTWVSPDVFEDTSIWEIHLGEVRKKFKFAHWLKSFIRKSWILTTLPFLYGIVVSALDKKISIAPLFYSLGISVLLVVVRIGLIALLRFYIQRKMKNFMTG